MAPSNRPADRRAIFWVCAGVILLFTLADTGALGHFSPLAFAVRLTWALVVGGSALLLPHLSPRAERTLLAVLGLTAPFFFSVVTAIVGGASSPLFHWILAMPLLIAVVIQDPPLATLLAGVGTLGSGLVLLRVAHAGAAQTAEWGIQAFAFCALAVYAARTYARVRTREAALQAREEFMSIAAHELRTPLTALKLAVESLRRSGEVLPPETHTRMGRVEYQLERLIRRVEQVLEASRLEGNAPTLRPEPLDLAEVVRDVTARLQPEALRRTTEIRVDAEPSPGVWDRASVEQVVGNLVENALKYGEGRPVDLSLHLGVEGVELRVQDHGIGIAAEDQARIFRKFERAVSPREFGGFGLGLYIVRRAIDQLGGSLTVQSAPGAGATFFVSLPRQPKTQAG